MYYSLVLRPLPHFPGFRTDKLPLHKRSLLPTLMYPVLVVMPLATPSGIPWLQQVGDIRPPFWACTKYPSLHVAIGEWRLGFSGVNYTVEVLSSRTARTVSPSL